MRAKKSLGQHFLKSERALAKIIEAGDIAPTDTILEIGPGQGALTERMLQTSAKLVAVEKDDELFEFLNKKFEKEIASGQLNLIHDDILKFDLRNPDASVGTPTLRLGYKLIANIPYNITGAILEKFLSGDSQPKKMVLLVQKEVAQRIVARGNKPLDSARGKESILSISVKAYGVPRYVETVLAGSFAPAPQVDSAIIEISGISKGFFLPPRQTGQGFSEPDFFKLLKAGFQSKRKKLSSNLSVIFDKNSIKEVFQELHLDENTRAEDVNIETWQKLAQNILTEEK